MNWDGYSNQPYIIKDKELKKEIYKKTLFASLKLLLTNLFILPILAIFYFFNLFKPSKPRAGFDNHEIFAMGISKENSTSYDKNRLKELGVEYLLIRFPMWEIDRIKEYKEYIEQFKEFNVLINLMQDRKYIENLQLLKKDIEKIFSTFFWIKEYQIGTTINRKKWEFYSVDEYLKFFQTIKEVRDKKFSKIKLIGSSVIDFEYHFTIASLFNFYKVYYDRFSALLYVDRRGSPFATQMGFDLFKKIELLYTLVKLSPKSSDTIYITETNWPLINTAPYAPTSEKECVSLQDYAEYMVAYYLITIATKKVKRVYWHQLNAKGYGLINNIDNKIYLAFYAYKFMVKSLKSRKLKRFNIKSKIKKFEFDGLDIFYHDNGFSKYFIQKDDLDIYGNKYKRGRILYRCKKIS